MNERTRSKLGAYFLFALLLLTLPVTLTVVHFDAVSKAKRWVRDGDSLKFVNVNSQERGIRFLMERDGISRDAAEKIAYQTQRETQTRLTDIEHLPLNSQIDYYEVDGTTDPQTASYKGSAAVLDPKSPLATAAISYWRNSPELKKERPEFLKFVESCLDKGFLLAPLGFAGTDPVDFKKERPNYGGGTVRPAATTTLYRVAVICTKFPGFRDVAPHSDGDTDPNDTARPYIDYNTHLAYPGPGTAGISTGSTGHAIGGSYGTTYIAEACYRSFAPPSGGPATIPKWNYATTADGGGDVPGSFPGPDYNTWDDTWPYCHSILDSVGGPFSASATWGVPIGIPSPWDWVYPAVMPKTDPDHSTTTSLQNYMFDLFYDQSTTSQAASNWFYYQTHGFVRPYGDRTDVVGWLYNGHQANRYDWQTGGGNEFFIFPGTPVIRLVSAPGVNPAADQIVRATLSSRGLTILFSHEVNLSLASLGLNVYTDTAVTDGDNGTDTTSPTSYTTSNGGWVSINFGAATVMMDPYDARRWTISGLRYQYLSGTIATPTVNTVSWPSANLPTGSGWNLRYGSYTDTSGTVLTAPAIPTGYGAALPPAFPPARPGAYYTWPTQTYVPQDQSTTHGGYRQGCPQLQNTEVTANDLKITLSDGGGTQGSTLSRPKNRLLSLDYYTHAFMPGTSYQITHLRNEWGYEDDISGTSVPNDDSHRAERPYPFDHEGDDPINLGYWAVTGESNGPNHKFGVYAGHAGQILSDNGIILSGYDATIHVNADCPNSLNQNRMYVQPISSLYLNENDARLTYFHEMGHALCGFGDLYDMDFVVNKTAPIPVPLFHECPAMDPYSFMAMGGGRVDGYHVYSKGYAETQAITVDTLGVQIPAVEGLLRDPIIVKLPGNPYYIKQNTPAGSWQEYFLLENRNYNSSNSTNGAWLTDSSTRGLYIYHIDARGPGKWNVAEGGDQRDDNVLAVIVEQADGKYELHYNNKGSWGDTAADPFGADTRTRVTRFWQFPMLNGEINDFGQAVQNVATTPIGGTSTAPVGSPPSWSHGFTYSERSGGSNLLIPGTESDSFTRVVKISNIGDNITCDIYVQPAEIQASRTALTTRLTRDISAISRAADVVTVTTTAAHGFVDGEHVTIAGVTDTSFNGTFEIASLPAANQLTYAQVGSAAASSGGTAKTGEVRQGATNVEFMKLTLVNPDGTGAAVTDLSKMSVKDVYIDNLYCLESGTSNNPLDIALAKLYVDNNNNGKIDGGEPMLQSVALTSMGTYYDYAVFTNLGYLLPLGQTRNLILAYDIAPEAQINPFITVGTEFTNARRIEPRLPGCVQDRVRNDAFPLANNAADPYNFGPSQFPLVSNTAVIVGYPDRLVITPDTTNMPTFASQGQTDLPMLKLNCAVNPGGVPRAQGSVRVDSMQVDEVGPMNAVTDLVNCKLYRDNGDGVLDSGTDTVLATSSFTPSGGDQRANFPNLNLLIGAGTPVNLFLAVTVSPSAAAPATDALQLSLKFGTEGPQPQSTCYVQLINNPTEADNNKDYVWYDTGVTTDWPIESLLVSIIPPNNPPTAPQPPFDPSGGSQISDTTPLMTWGAASDPDPADLPSLLRYEIQIADNASFTSPVVSATTPPGQTEYQVTTDLALGTSYWWRVRAKDPQDATGPWSVTQTFQVVTNRAPNQIVGAPPPGFVPPNATTVTTLTPAMSWNPTTDPDATDTPATLRYHLKVDDNNDFSSPNVDWISPAAVTSYNVTVGNGLQWGTIYYWQVTALDVADLESTPSITIWFRPVQDSAPYDPIAPFVPTGGTEVTTANPVLTWSMPNPPDPDPTDPLDTIHYVVQLKKGVPSSHSDMTVVSPGETLYEWTTPVDVRQWQVDHDNTIPAPTLNLEDDCRYYWWVRAVDDEGKMSDWSAVQNFWVNLDNDPPNPPTSGFDPNNGEQIGDNTPRIVWNHATDPDSTDTYNTLHYIIQLSSDNFGAVAQQYTTGDGQNFADVTTPLTDLTMWYYRVKTVDDQGAESGWSDVQFFYLDVGNQPPTLTNPSCVPLYGDITTFFQLYITYTDAEDDKPDWVRCTISADGGDITLDMAKLNPADNNATDGIRYVVGVSAVTVGLGAHGNYFTAGITAGGPPVPVVQAQQPAVGYNRGPIVGTPSTTQFITGAGGGEATSYEEGNTVWVRVTDADENDDAGALDSVQVLLQETAGDAEIVLLTETGNDTGIFEGSLPTLGRAGAITDGFLNARAGASGNTITATYQDADDDLNPTPDTSSDTALVVDTTAPAQVIGLAVTSGIHGRTANLDWTSYNEAGQVDVAGYHIYYRSGTTFTSALTSGLTMVTVPAGTQTYVISGLTPTIQYFFAVTAFDEVPNENYTVVTTSVTTADITAPAISAQFPTSPPLVDRNTNISFNLADPGVGVEQSTLSVVVKQNGVDITTSNFGPPTITGNQYNMQVVLTPTVPLKWNATIIVEVDVKDFVPNQLITNWSFQTVQDYEVPTIGEQQPAPGATGVPVTTQISFELYDTGSGIDQSSVQLSLSTYGAPVAWSSLLFTPLANGVRVAYDPPGDLSYSSHYDVSVTAKDVAGNVLGPVDWSFDTVVDSSSVVIDPIDPLENALNVPTGTNVSVRLSDPQSGIRVVTFRMWVYGTEVTGSPDLTIVQTPPAPSLASTANVTYDPPADFPFATDIYVRVYVEDAVHNVADKTYKFTTAAAPTYLISGLIQDQDGKALPGVQVTAGGQTVVSDGNGAYRILGLLDGVYVVTPTRDQYDFAPVTRNVDVGPDDVTNADFVGTLRTYHLRGRVTEATVGLGGVTVTCGGKSATTDTNGDYDIAGLPNGQYTVTPTLGNYHFSPPNRAAQISGADVNGVNFDAVADTFSVSGTVRDNTGNRVEGVQVACGGKVSVTNAAGQYLISGLRAGSYTVTPTKTGYTMSPPTRDVAVPPDQIDRDFTANLEMVTVLPNGLSLIGVPGTPIDRNPLSVFGATNFIYRYKPDAVPPTWLVAQNDPTVEMMQVKAGRGFFVRFGGVTTLRVAGVPTTGSVSIGLSEGWNMIANPRVMPTKFSSFVSSIPDGIRPYAFVYENATGGYKLVSSTPSVGAERDSLVGWEGAWVRAMSGGVSLLVSAGAAAAEPQQPEQANLNGGWTIPIVARAGNRGDTTTVAGVVPGSNGAHCIDNPPSAPNTVDAYLTDAAGARLAHDIRSELAAQLSFDFVVACTVPDATVTVTLPDLSQVPRSQQVMLIDRQTGKSLYARTLPAYTYRSEGESSERQFQLVVSPHSIGALAVSAAAAQTAGQNVALTYTVTRACNISVRVLNMAGRCIRILTTDKPVSAGAQTELWNLCADSGTRVPTGTYLMQIEAVAENGQRVRGMTQVRVGR